MRKVYYWGRALLRRALPWRWLTSLLSTFGAMWMLISVANFFWPGASLPAGGKDPAAGEMIRPYWWVFLIIGIGVMVWRSWPKGVISCRLKARDVTIEVKIGDFFKRKGDFIIGTNTTFDTRIDPKLISKDSLQGQFTKRYFDSDSKLAEQFQAGLKGLPSKRLQGQRNGNAKEYDIGTVVQVEAGEQRAFFVAMARLNQNGKAKVTDEELRTSFSRLWEFIATHSAGRKLVVPLMGSRFSQAKLTREEIVRELIKSFIPACAEGSICEKLTIVISGYDVVEHNIDLDELEKFLHHVCRYTSLAPADAPQVGSPVIAGA